MKSLLEKLNLPHEVQGIIQNSKKVVVAKNREELLELSYGSTENDEFHVSYDVKGKGTVQEVTVNRCKNGAVVNYLEDYMRRRDPDCLIVSDELGTDNLRMFTKLILNHCVRKHLTG